MSVEILFDLFVPNKAIASGGASGYLASLAPCECDIAFLFSFFDIPNAGDMVDDIASIVETSGVDHINIFDSGVSGVFFLGFLKGNSIRYNERAIFSSIGKYFEKMINNGVIRVQLYKDVKYYDIMHKMTAEDCLFDQFVNRNNPFGYNS